MSDPQSLADIKPLFRPEHAAAIGPRFEAQFVKIVKSIDGFVDPKFDESPFRALKKRFVVACSGRTGSHLLCQGLNEHGGFAQELFHLPRMAQICLRRGISTLQGYCELTARNRSVEGVFGVKGGIHVMVPLLLSGEAPTYLAEWGFVWLKRRDLVKQAISGYVASITGAYKASKTPARHVVDDDFDGAEIAERAARNITNNEIWEEIFEHYGIEPYRVYYEELAQNPKEIARGAAAHLGLDGPPIADERFLSEPVEQQATDLNDRWAKRFRDEGWRIEGPSDALDLPSWL